MRLDRCGCWVLAQLDLDGRLSRFVLVSFTALVVCTCHRRCGLCLIPSSPLSAIVLLLLWCEWIPWAIAVECIGEGGIPCGRPVRERRRRQHRRRRQQLRRHANTRRGRECELSAASINPSNGNNAHSESDSAMWCRAIDAPPLASHTSLYVFVSVRVWCVLSV